jgi:nicotinate-nucleotide adenylyltransferase
VGVKGRTGLLGGAFDPPHRAHVVLAREAIRCLELERLVVVVTGQAPHKEVATPAEIRYRLAEAAFAGVPGVELSRHELDRPGPSYTVDTVRWASRQWGGEIVFVVGADEFADFLDWKDPNGVLRFASLGVATRPGYPRQRLDAVLCGLEHPERVHFFDIPELPVSSTEIRARAARGEPLDDLCPPRVAELVAELGLYRAKAPSS